jgi:hypothetical protein
LGKLLVAERFYVLRLKQQAVASEWSVVPPRRVLSVFDWHLAPGQRFLGQPLLAHAAIAPLAVKGDIPISTGYRWFLLDFVAPLLFLLYSIYLSIGWTSYLLSS